MTSAALPEIEAYAKETRVLLAMASLQTGILKKREADRSKLIGMCTGLTSIPDYTDSLMSIVLSPQKEGAIEKFA